MAAQTFDLSREDAIRIYSAAVWRYVADIHSELSTGRNPDRAGEYPSALDDWTGGRYQLARLAQMGGLDVQELADAIDEALVSYKRMGAV